MDISNIPSAGEYRGFVGGFVQMDDVGKGARVTAQCKLFNPTFFYQGGLILYHQDLLLYAGQTLEHLGWSQIFRHSLSYVSVCFSSR